MRLTAQPTRGPGRIARRTALGAAIGGMVSGACTRNSAPSPASRALSATASPSKRAASDDEPAGARDSKIHARQPTLYLPHGGGPCFFMDWPRGPKDMWKPMAEWLGNINAALPTEPKALLVISAHWEEPQPTVTSHPSPPLLYDYYGFPPHTYELTWPAPGSPDLAERVRHLLDDAGFASAGNRDRGLDHGVFIPLKLSYPDAHIPTIQLSLIRGLDPANHLAMGRALAPLRDEGVFIIGSGMSYHNMRAFMTTGAGPASETFDAWLSRACTGSPTTRSAALSDWQSAPESRASHPREEHLLPLMVVAGAAESETGQRVFSDVVMGARVSALQFG